MGGIVDHRVAGAERDLRQLVRALFAFGQGDAPALEPVAVHFIVEKPVGGGVGQRDLGDLAADMSHVIAPQRSLHAAEQAGPCPLRRQKQARRLDAACGHDQGFDGQVRACRSVGNRDRLDLCRVGVEPDIHNRGIQHDADVVAGLQPITIDMRNIRVCDPAFQRVAADAAIVGP